MVKAVLSIRSVERGRRINVGPLRLNDIIVFLLLLLLVVVVVLVEARRVVGDVEMNRFGLIMSSELVGSGEPFPTDRAFEFLDQRMRPHVFREVRRFRELGRASLHRTLKWL